MTCSKFGRALAALLLLCSSAGPAVAADTKISAMPPASALNGTEAVPVVQGGANKAATTAQIKTYSQSGLATVATSGSATDLTTGTLPAARLPLFSSTANGAAPASGGGTTNFLRADGSWAAPPGGGAGTTTNALTFNTSGGASPGTTFNGSLAKTVDYSTIGAAPVVTPTTTQAGTTYTTVLGDANSDIRFTNASPVTVTIPPNSSVAYPVGTVLGIIQAGTGQVTLAAGAGVTINSPSGLALAGQYAAVGLKEVSADTWLLTGDLAGVTLAPIATSGSASDLSAGTVPAARMPALTGDVTSSAGSVSTSIAGNAVTYGKFQQIAASSLVGNPTGSTANAQGITLAGGLSFSGTALTVSGAISPTSVSGTGTATFAVGAAAGTGATMACTAGRVCDSISGDVTLVTGTSPTTGTLGTITLPITRTNPPNCVVRIRLAAVNSYTDTETTNTITLATGTGTLTASTTWSLSYVCGGN